MPNRRYNTQVAPQFKAGGRVKRMGGGMSTARRDMRSGYYKNDMGMKGGKMYKEGGKVKKSKKGAINPGEKDEERSRKFLKDRQKKAAKIEMVSKMAKRMKKGKYGTPAPGSSKATDFETALNTFNVQKSADKMRKDDPKYAKKVGDLDLISERNLSRKEGSMAKGGRVGKKEQGYKDRKDESIAMRVKKKRTKKQLRASANESYGKFGSKARKSGKINK